MTKRSAKCTRIREMCVVPRTDHDLRKFNLLLTHGKVNTASAVIWIGHGGKAKGKVRSL